MTSQSKVYFFIDLFGEHYVYLQVQTYFSIIGPFGEHCVSLQVQTDFTLFKA